jgi:hypothetical protein
MTSAPRLKPAIGHVVLQDLDCSRVFDAAAGDFVLLR